MQTTLPSQVAGVQGLFGLGRGRCTSTSWSPALCTGFSRAWPWSTILLELCRFWIATCPGARSPKAGPRLEGLGRFVVALLRWRLLLDFIRPSLAARLVSCQPTGPSEAQILPCRFLASALVGLAGHASLTSRGCHDSDDGPRIGSGFCSDSPHPAPLSCAPTVVSAPLPPGPPCTAAWTLIPPWGFPARVLFLGFSGFLGLGVAGSV